MTLDPEFPSRPYVYVLYAFDARSGGMPPSRTTTARPARSDDEGCVISGRLSRLTAGERQQDRERAARGLGAAISESLDRSAGVRRRRGALRLAAKGRASTRRLRAGREAPQPAGQSAGRAGRCADAADGAGGALRAARACAAPPARLLNGSVIRVDPRRAGRCRPIRWRPRRTATPGASSPTACAIRSACPSAPAPASSGSATSAWTPWEEINRVVDRSAAAEHRELRLALLRGQRPAERLRRGPTWTAARRCTPTAGQTAAVLHLSTPRAAWSANEGCPVGDSSVTGMAFYTGDKFPAEYPGALFFGDYSRECVWVMARAPTAMPESG